MAVEYDVKPIHDGLVALVARMSDLSPVLNEIGEIIASSIDRNFQEGGRFGADNQFGGGSDRWQRSKRAIAQSGLTLVDRSTLRASITYRPQPPDTVIVGTNIVYAAIHQYGGATGKKHKTILPARPYVVVQNDDLDDIKDVLADYLAALTTK